MYKTRAPGCPANYTAYSGTQYLQHNYDSLSLYIQKSVSVTMH